MEHRKNSSMKINKKNLIGILCVMGMVMAVLIVSCSTSKKPETADNKNAENDIRVLVIGTADSGGSMYAASSHMVVAIKSQYDNLRFNINASTGSRENIREILNGSYDLAFVTAEACVEALSGSSYLKDSPTHKLRTLGAVYPSISNWMVSASSNIEYVHDLEGKKISVGPNDSSTYYTAIKALYACGIEDEGGNFIHQGLGSGSRELKAGSLDAIHGFAGIPIPGFSVIADSMPCRMIGFTDEELSAICYENSTFFRVKIPAKTYPGQEEDVDTFASKCMLCVSSDMDDDLAYYLTEALMNTLKGHDEGDMLNSFSDPSFRLENLPIPLHNGAAQYYSTHVERS